MSFNRQDTFLYLKKLRKKKSLLFGISWRICSWGKVDKKRYLNSSYDNNKAMDRWSFTSVIILPRVLFRSRWLAFFSRVCITRSRVVRYSSANSEMIRASSWGLVRGTRCRGTPSHSEKRWKRCMIRRCTMPSTMIRWAQSLRNSDILRKRKNYWYSGKEMIFWCENEKENQFFSLLKILKMV